MGNEYVVAVLILAWDEIFLFAFAFDDFVMTIGIAAKNARRLPRRGQNLRRRNFKVVMQNIRLRQMEPLDDMHFAVVWNADRFADRDIGLWRNGSRVDHQHIAIPMTDRMAVQCQIGIFGMRTAVGIDAPHAVAV